MRWIRSPARRCDLLARGDVDLERPSQSYREPEQRIEHWSQAEGVVLGRAASTLEEIWADETPDLARLSVGLRVVRTLLSTQ